MSAIQPSTIRQLLADRGQTLTFRRETEGSYDPATGTNGAASTDDETIKGCFLNYQDNLFDGDNVVRGDRRLIMSNYQSDGTVLSKSPQPGDKFIGQGDTVSVINAQTLKDGGNLIGFICQVRE